jgi:hypothetical protein
LIRDLNSFAEFRHITLLDFAAIAALIGALSLFLWV